MTTDEIRAIMRESRLSLEREVLAWAGDHGSKWVIGGPKYWSKDELVNAVVRIREGGEP